MQAGCAEKSARQRLQRASCFVHPGSRNRQQLATSSQHHVAQGFPWQCFLSWRNGAGFAWLLCIKVTHCIPPPPPLNCCRRALRSCGGWACGQTGRRTRCCCEPARVSWGRGEEMAGEGGEECQMTAQQACFAPWLPGAPPAIPSASSPHSLVFCSTALQPRTRAPHMRRHTMRPLINQPKCPLYNRSSLLCSRAGRGCRPRGL